ncbi:thiamine pyrophosphokinase [Spiroplasma gladiatoris]|uniref:Thiamine diphosphokinase n=1 Tax=Spiroplasma gladiatoris TaxID=2143 RepID=A0A4P7AK18_9MOLU|nr:thiamine diphosphokinase [Spiroplasma gladiatoris]QBQ08016.1 thiamine pyrophosphokinase [Spiroplasma gladiatoris]
MKTKFLIIACENNINLTYYSKTHWLIGVERGCLDIINKGFKVDIAISDFDHVLNEELELIKNNSEDFIQLNNEKDYLDGKEAIQKAYELGATEILMLVKPTKRVDMNLSLIEFCTKERVKVFNESSFMFCLQKGENKIEFEKYQDYTYITLFPIHQTSITIKGLKYEVEDLMLLPYSTRAYSNCFLNNQDAIIKTDKSILIIFNK